jgi:hypothetical protein
MRMIESHNPALQWIGEKSTRLPLSFSLAERKDN